MKPTQQEIIDLARELRRIANPNESRIYQHERGKLFEAARMLERFGAGGGEPVARLMMWTRDGPFIKKGHIIARTYEECPKDTYLDGWGEAAELYTHPSTADLRAEYLRGLEDAAKVARAGYDTFWQRHEPEFPKAKYDQASVLRTLHSTVEFVSTDITEAIEALKGKQ